MRSHIAAAVLLSLIVPLGAARAEPVLIPSRVIVSSTLNSTLHVFDAQSLAETQPPLLSRGTSPVRLAVFKGMGRPVLLTANHGVEGSVGVFDLSGDIVLEKPISPMPARAGAVGIDATVLSTSNGPLPVAYVTNTWQALGGCGLPAGSLTAYQMVGLDQPEALVEMGTVELSGAIPYAVAAGTGGRAYASTNCADQLDTVTTGSGLLGVQRTTSRPTGNGPDGVVFDGQRIFVTNISGNSVSVFDETSPAALATVPLPGGGPIDITLADSPSGRRWAITANGADDTVSLINRDVAAACAGDCPQAQVARIATGVPDGAPEGVAYDPVSNRVFVVNKPIGGPSLTVIQLTESGSSVTGAPIGTIPLTLLGSAVPQIPDIIAFDVVVQTR